MKHGALRLMGWALAAGALALALVVVLGWPLLATVFAAIGRTGATAGSGLMDTRAGFAEVARPLGLARVTAELVLLTELIALPLGIPLAVLLFRTDVWGRRLILALLALAVFVPLPLHATAWLGALGNAGRSQVLGLRPILVGLPGAAFVHAMAALPWVVLLTGVGLCAIEPELEEAAWLEWPAWRVMLGVTLRRSVGAIAAAALAVAVLTAGDMTVTDLLQVRTYAEEAYVQFQLGRGPGAAAMVSLPPLIVLGGLLLWAARGLLRVDPARVASVQKARVWRLGRWRFELGALLVLVVGNLVALPVYGLLWRAGRVGGSAATGQAPHWSLAGLFGTLRLAADEVAGPLVTSLIWAAVGASVTLAIAWPLAWLSRHAGPWRWLALAAVAMALATPGPVAGMALVLAYNAPRPGPGASLLARWLFELRVSIYDTPAVVVLAYVLRTLPYVLLILWPALRAVPETYLDVAAVEGYGPLGRVRRVVIPLTLGPAAAAWGVAFVLGMGELPTTNLVYPPGTMPLSVVVWSLLHTGVESHLAGVGLIMLGAIGLAAAGAAWTVRRLYLARSADRFLSSS